MVPLAAELYYTASQEVGGKGIWIEVAHSPPESHDIQEFELKSKKMESYQDVGFPTLYARLARLFYYIRVGPDHN